MKIKDKIEVKIIDLDYQGQGVAKYKDYTIFIKGLLPKEKALVEIFKIKNKIAFAEIINILEKAKLRKKINNNLDSTDLIHLNDKEQIIWQNKITEDTFLKIANTNIKINNNIYDLNYYNYRNKVVFHTLKDETLKFGMYYKNKLVLLNEFILANPLANKILKHINSLNLKIKNNPIRSIVIKNNYKNEFIVTIVSKEKKFNKLEVLINEFKKFPFIKTLTLNINKNPRHILSNESIIIYGNNKLIEKYNNASVYFDDLSFLQTNYNVTNLLYDEILKHIKKDDIVIDSYSGVGSIGFSVSKKAKYVYLLEINKNSYEKMLEAKKDFNYNNTKILYGDVFENINKTKGNVLIVDPPRFGLTKKFIDEILKNEYDRIIYLSCNIRTQARDYNLLKEKYKIKYISSVKMFYQTSSIENLIILEKKQSI